MPNSLCPAVKSTSSSKRYGVVASATMTASDELASRFLAWRMALSVSRAWARVLASGTMYMSLGPLRLYLVSTPDWASCSGLGSRTTGLGSSPTRICDLEMTMTTPSCAGSVVMIESGTVRSVDCGIDALDDAMLLSKKTRMIVIRSSIAVMLRKSISGSRAFLRIDLRSAAL